MDKTALAAHFKAEAAALLKRLTDDAYEGDDIPAQKAADSEAMTKALDTAEGYEAEIKAAAAESDALAASEARLKALGGMEGANADSSGNPDPAKKGDTGDGFTPVPEQKAQGNTPAPTAGEVFTKSDGFAASLKSGFNTDAAETVELKSLITSPSLPSNNRYENYAPMPLTLLDAISVIDTGAEAIVVHRLLLSANNAAIHADGVTAPESDFTWQTVTLTPDTLSHWVPVNLNTMADHGTVRGIIDVELAWGLRDKIQTNIMTDLGSTTGLLVQAFTTDILTTLLDAKTAAEAVRTPTAIIMSPQDVNTIQNLKGTDGHYVGGGPFTYSALVVWGLPVVSSSACPVGTAYVGNTNSVIWRNRQSVEITTGWRGTQFTDRQLTIMATARGMLDVTLPGAMVKAALA